MVITLSLLAVAALPQQPQESDYYEVIDVTIPDEVVLEVGGIEQIGPETLLACTRRGEVWRIDDFRSETPGAPRSHRRAAVNGTDGATVWEPNQILAGEYANCACETCLLHQVQTDI